MSTDWCNPQASAEKFLSAVGGHQQRNSQLVKEQSISLDLLQYFYVFIKLFFHIMKWLLLISFSYFCSLGKHLGPFELFFSIYNQSFEFLHPKFCLSHFDQGSLL